MFSLGVLWLRSYVLSLKSVSKNYGRYKKDLETKQRTKHWACTLSFRSNRYNKTSEEQMY